MKIELDKQDAEFLLEILNKAQIEGIQDNAIFMSITQSIKDSLKEEIINNKKKMEDQKEKFTKEQKSALVTVCDIALKTGGIEIYDKVTVVLAMLNESIPKDK